MGSFPETCNDPDISAIFALGLLGRLMKMANTSIHSLVCKLCPLKYKERLTVKEFQMSKLSFVVFGCQKDVSRRKR